jgi:PEP-CTERM motif
MRLTTMRMLLPCLAVALALAGSARADVGIEFYLNGSLQSGDTQTSAGTALTVGPVLVGNFMVSGFNVTANLGGLSLNGSGTIINEATTPNSTLTIVISENGYTGPVATMGSSSGYSFTGLDSTNTSTFQSFGTVGSVLFDKTGISSPGAAYSIIPVGPIGSGSHDEPNTAFPANSTFTLTQVYTYSVNSAGGNTGDTYKPTGVTTAIAAPAAAPEPSTLVLLVSGSIGFFAIRRRRRA